MSQKDQIAETLERHIARYGYAKTTLDEIARELHISKKTIYVHFDGKREIYEYIVGRMAKAEQRRMRSVLAPLATNREKVQAHMRMVLAAGRAHVQETSATEWLQEYEIAGDAFKKAHGDLLRELVAEGMATGEFPAGDPRLVDVMLAAMFGEYLVMINAEPGYDRDEELLERMLRFIG